MTTCLGILYYFTVQGQSIPNLPLWNKQQSTIKFDWLISNTNARATLYQTEDGKLVFSNGIVARTFSLTPNGATVGLDLLNNNESFIRSVRPEAEIETDGMKMKNLICDSARIC